MTAPLAPPRPFSPIGLLGDGALARRIGRGDELAFEELYRRYHGPLYRYCVSILGNPQEAEEALQSAMFKAYRALRDSGQKLQLRAWLYRIAHNQCLDTVRRRRESQELSGLEEEGGLGVDEQVVLREDVRQLRRDLAALPPGQRSALVLREMSGLTHAEIADTLEGSPAAAKQLIHDARRNLVAFETGRQLPCDDVQRAISDDDGRVLRGGAIRGHLRACPDCTLFRISIRDRDKRLEALFPPLAPAAAKDILATVVGVDGVASGGALLTSGLGSGLAGGLAAKIAVIGAVVVAGTAVVAVPGGLADRFAASGRPSTPAAERGTVASAFGGSRGASAVLGGAAKARAARPSQRPDPAPAPAEPPGPDGPTADAADPAAALREAGASAAVGDASARVSADVAAGSAGVRASVGPASAAASAGGPSVTGGASVAVPSAAATVTVGDGSADVSAETPVGTVEVLPDLP